MSELNFLNGLKSKDLDSEEMVYLSHRDPLASCGTTEKVKECISVWIYEHDILENQLLQYDAWSATLISLHIHI